MAKISQSTTAPSKTTNLNKAQQSAQPTKTDITSAAESNIQRLQNFTHDAKALSSIAALRGMQSRIGNYAMGRFIEAKLAELAVGKKTVEQEMKQHSQLSTGMVTHLPSTVQSQMEQSFNQDFSNVAIYPNSSKALQIGARAFAKGNELHFSPGEYQPNTVSGQKLLGHELAHVVQQRAGLVAATSQKINGMIVNDASHLENLADTWGGLAARGHEITQLSNTNSFSPAANIFSEVIQPTWYYNSTRGVFTWDDDGKKLDCYDLKAVARYLQTKVEIKKPGKEKWSFELNAKLNRNWNKLVFKKSSDKELSTDSDSEPDSNIGSDIDVSFESESDFDSDDNSESASDSQVEINFDEESFSDSETESKDTELIGPDINESESNSISIITSNLEKYGLTTVKKNPDISSAKRRLYCNILNIFHPTFMVAQEISNAPLIWDGNEQVRGIKDRDLHNLHLNDQFIDEDSNEDFIPPAAYRLKKEYGIEYGPFYFSSPGSYREYNPLIYDITRVEGRPKPYFIRTNVEGNYELEASKPIEKFSAANGQPREMLVWKIILKTGRTTRSASDSKNKKIYIGIIHTAPSCKGALNVHGQVEDIMQKAEWLKREKGCPVILAGDWYMEKSNKTLFKALENNKREGWQLAVATVQPGDRVLPQPKKASKAKAKAKAAEKNNLDTNYPGKGLGQAADHFVVCDQWELEAVRPLAKTHRQARHFQNQGDGFAVPLDERDDLSVYRDIDVDHTPVIMVLSLKNANKSDGDSSDAEHDANKQAKPAKKQPPKKKLSDDHLILDDKYIINYVKMKINQLYGYKNDTKLLNNKNLGGKQVLFLDATIKNTKEAKQADSLAFHLDKTLDPKSQYDIFDDLEDILKPNCNIQILFPYNHVEIKKQRFRGHWLIGEIKIVSKQSNCVVEIFTHDPLGNGQMDSEIFKMCANAIKQKITPKFKNLKIINQLSPYGVRQNDNTSCAAIVAAEIIKLIQGKVLDDDYPAGAKDLLATQAEELRAGGLANLVPQNAQPSSPNNSTGETSVTKHSSKKLIDSVDSKQFAQHKGPSQSSSESKSSLEKKKQKTLAKQRKRSSKYDESSSDADDSKQSAQDKGSAKKKQKTSSPSGDTDQAKQNNKKRKRSSGSDESNDPDYVDSKQSAKHKGLAKKKLTKKIPLSKLNTKKLDNELDESSSESEESQVTDQPKQRKNSKGTGKQQQQISHAKKRKRSSKYDESISESDDLSDSDSEYFPPGKGNRASKNKRKKRPAKKKQKTSNPSGDTDHNENKQAKPVKKLEAKKYPQKSNANNSSKKPLSSARNETTIMKRKREDSSDLDYDSSTKHERPANKKQKPLNPSSDTYQPKQPKNNKRKRSSKDDESISESSSEYVESSDSDSDFYSDGSVSDSD